METQQIGKHHQQPFINNGYLYVVVFYDQSHGFYDVTHFKTASKAKRYNEERLAGNGQVMTTRQLAKNHDCFPL